ncbi:DUF134 domain-containing protein [Candidatus Woesearchaeota archaeon]|nr:DUF134 domain-containing protein [Candidatus Woesearchaeota archaeon]
MVRPRKTKNVNFDPDVCYFKPRAVPLSQLEEVQLTIDELESMRLSNIEKLNQIDAAMSMGVHQSTFHRTLSRANEKVADALVNGKAIRIHGGDYKMPARDGTGPAIRNLRGMGRRRGPYGAGSTDYCICPKCGKRVPHIRGEPCNQRKCNECDTLMTRE